MRMKDGRSPSLRSGSGCQSSGPQPPSASSQSGIPNAGGLHVSAPHLCEEIADGRDSWWAEYSASAMSAQRAETPQEAQVRSTASAVAEGETPNPSSTGENP